MTPLFWNVVKVLMSFGIFAVLTIGYLRPTEKTVYTQPVNQYHSFENMKVGFGGCAFLPKKMDK